MFITKHYTQDLREIGLGVWIGFNWLRIGIGGKLL
jgi:hypothetical protein